MTFNVCQFPMIYNIFDLSEKHLLIQQQQVLKLQAKYINTMAPANTSSQKHANPNIVYIIADQSTNVSYLYEYFGFESIQDQATCLRFEIFNLSNKNNTFQLYIFPRNRQIKPYCQLYTEILPKPHLVIYAIEDEAPIQQAAEWLNIFEKDNSLRIMFFSSVRTYLERQSILLKLNTLFLKDITNSISFPNIDPAAFDNCFFNIQTAGIAMRFYARRIPAFSRLKWIWKKIANKFKKTKNEQYSSSSVI